MALIATGHGVVRWQQDKGVTRVYTDADGLPVNQTQAVLTDGAGHTWIGTNNGTVVLRNGVIEPVADPGLGPAYVYRFREDEQGRVWAAARTGLFIHAADGTVTRLAAADGLSDATLWDMSPDPHSGMWVGSNGDGLRWVAIHGTEHAEIDNSAEFVARVKTGITVLSESRQVWVGRQVE